jgi:hypothetical protein
MERVQERDKRVLEAAQKQNDASSMKVTVPLKLPQGVRALESGAGDGDRTRDIQLGKLAFYR